MTLTTIKHGRHRYKKYKIMPNFMEMTHIVFMISSAYTKTEEQNGAN